MTHKDKNTTTSHNLTKGDKCRVILKEDCFAQRAHGSPIKLKGGTIIRGTFESNTSDGWCIYNEGYGFVFFCKRFARIKS